MQTPGPLEIVVILVVALLVFGPNKLPEIGRQAGKAMREFRRFQNSFRDEVRDFVDPDKPAPAQWQAPAAPAAPPPQWPQAPPPQPQPQTEPLAEEVVDAEIVTEQAPNANSAGEARPATEGPEDTTAGPTTT